MMTKKCFVKWDCNYTSHQQFLPARKRFATTQVSNSNEYRTSWRKNIVYTLIKSKEKRVFFTITHLEGCSITWLFLLKKIPLQGITFTSSDMPSVCDNLIFILEIPSLGSTNLYVSISTYMKLGIILSSRDLSNVQFKGCRLL